jgi:hypothetical protein
MSECAIVGIGLTVGNPPDNKVCLQSSPNSMDKKERDGKRNAILSGSKTQVGPISSGYTIEKDRIWVEVLVSDISLAAFGEGPLGTPTSRALLSPDRLGGGLFPSVGMDEKTSHDSIKLQLQASLLYCLPIHV